LPEGSVAVAVTNWPAGTAVGKVATKGATPPGLVVTVVERLASGGADKTVKLWDLATGQEVLSLKGHARRVNSISFSSDGNRLASGTDLGEGAVRVWEAATSE
jgi:WD40 repeat protein